MNSNLKNLSKEPFLTVILPVYNGARYLSQCLNSLLNQSCKDFQLIIINDGSTDNTAEIIKGFYAQNSLGICVIHLEQNKGVSYAKNQALKQLITPYFTFVGADDICQPDLIEEYKSSMSDGKTDLCVVKCKMIDETGNLLSRSKGYPRNFNTKSLLYHQIRRNYLWSGLTCFKNYQGLKYFDNNLKNGVDYDFSFQYLLKGAKIKIVNKELVLYRTHDENISRNLKVSRNSVQVTCRKLRKGDLTDRLSLYYNSEQTQLCVGYLKFHQGYYRASLDSIKKINASNLKKAEIFELCFLKSTLNYLLRDIKAAYKEMSSLYKTQQSNASVLNNLAVLSALLDKNSYSLALKLLYKAVRLRPGYSDASQNIDVLFNNSNKDLCYTLLPIRESFIHI